MIVVSSASSSALWSPQMARGYVCTQAVATALPSSVGREYLCDILVSRWRSVYVARDESFSPNHHSSSSISPSSLPDLISLEDSWGGEALDRGLVSRTGVRS